jgi:hypothetical protein
LRLISSPVLEALEHRGPVACRTVQIAVLDVLRVQPGAHHVEETGELAEDQRSVPAVDHVTKLFEQGVDLGAGKVPTLLVDEPGVQAQLAQEGQ